MKPDVPTKKAGVPARKRSVTTGVVVAATLAVVLQTGLARSSRADVAAVSMPSQVSVSHRMVVLHGSVRVGAGADGTHSATLWFNYPPVQPASRASGIRPEASVPTKVGSASSHRAGFLTVTATIDAGRIVPGRNLLQVVDGSDGARRTIVLDLRRRSRVSITGVTFGQPGQAAVRVKVMHFDPKLGRFAPSQFSPVRLQEDVAGGWVTLTTITSDRLGLAGTVLPADSGTHYYRAVRPGGATVTAATSLTVRAGQKIPTITLDPAAAHKQP